VLFLAPGRDRRSLDELLRRRPTVGRNFRSASITGAGAAVKPDRYPVIDERLESVLKTTTLVRSDTCSADAGGSSNHSSEYASSEHR
jgi:hypothetical protein